jgi:hypothetical protein
MAIHTSNPYSKTDILDLESQTYENMTPKYLENLGPDTKSISYVVSNDEVKTFRHITWAYTI